MNTILQLIKERSVLCEKADLLSNLFGKEVQNVLSGNKPVVLYGAGSAGQELLPLLSIHGVSPACFCDKKHSTNNAKVSGLSVISFQKLCDEHKNSLICISTGKYAEEVKRDLLQNGFQDENIICIHERQLFFYTNVHQWYWTDAELSEKQANMQLAYDLLSDVKSKEVFVDRVSCFSSGTDYNLYRSFVETHADLKYSLANTHSEIDISMHESTFYFRNDVLELADKEILVDGGGYTGDSVQEFLTLMNGESLEYKKIYTFEPDPENFKKLVINLSDYPNIEKHNLGLWDDEARINFLSSATIESVGGQIDAGCKIDIENGDIGIDTTSIDKCCVDGGVSFIKLDVEGAEIKALIGAKSTIRKNKPKFAISAYHKRDDIFEILLQINEICPDYKFYLRHYSNNFLDTILFAIPK